LAAEWLAGVPMVALAVGMHEYGAASATVDLDSVRPPWRVTATRVRDFALVANGGFGTPYPGHVGTKSEAVALLIT
jgi:hypothetical protein